MEHLFKCPRCHSDNTASFPMIYQGGTTTGNFSALSYGTNAGVIGTGGKTKSQSLLAQQTAPPQKQNNGCLHAFITVLILFGSMFVFTLVMTALVGESSLTGLLAFIFGMVATIFYAVHINRNSKAENKVWREQIAQWEKSWMCLKCGNKWYMNH